MKTESELSLQVGPRFGTLVRFQRYDCFLAKLLAFGNEGDLSLLYSLAATFFWTSGIEKREDISLSSCMCPTLTFLRMNAHNAWEMGLSALLPHF